VIVWFDEVRNREAWTNKHLVPIWYTLCPHKGIASGDGRFCSHREIASSNVKGVFLADGRAMGLRQFCTHHKEHFLKSKLWEPDREFFGTGEKCHPSSTLNKLKREHGGEKPCSDQNILPGACHKSGWRLEWRVLRGSAYAVRPIRKDLVVFSVGSALLKHGES
jgi:nitrite reductase/ring-hydroxylating ferredoxin subunit